MKLQKDPPWLSALVLGLGILGFGLRLGVYNLAVDDKGLLISGHPLQTAFWCLCVLAAALVAVFTGSTEPRMENSRIGTLGEVVLALALLYCLVTGVKNARVALDGIRLGLGAAAVAGLALAALRRWQGREVPVLCYAAVCVFLAVHLVWRYRSWSARPQLQDTLLPVLGGIAMLVFSYLRCVAEKLRLRRVAGLLGSFACLCALAHCQDPALYLGGACWLLTNREFPGGVQ